MIAFIEILVMLKMSCDFVCLDCVIFPKIAICVGGVLKKNNFATEICLRSTKFKKIPKFSVTEVVRSPENVRK